MPQRRTYTRTHLCDVTARWWRVGRTSGLGLWAEVPMPDVYSCVVLKGTRQKPAFSSKRRAWGRTKSVEKGLKVSFHVLGSSENLDICREKGKADAVGQRLLGREALWVEFTDTCGHQIYLFCSKMNARKSSSCAEYLRTTFSASSSSNGRLIVQTVVFSFNRFCLSSALLDDTD